MTTQQALQEYKDQQKLIHDAKVEKDITYYTKLITHKLAPLKDILTSMNKTYYAFTTQNWFNTQDCSLTISTFDDREGRLLILKTIYKNINIHINNIIQQAKEYAIKEIQAL